MDRRFGSILLLAMWTAVAIGAHAENVEPTETAETAETDAAQVAVAVTGRITGVIDKPDQVAAVYVIDRRNTSVGQLAVRKYPAQLDRKTGRFTASKLPLGIRYDCVIQFGKALLEGVDLSVKAAMFEDDFGTPVEVKEPLTDDDRQTITDLIRGQSKFMDRADVLAMRGNPLYAAVLVNKVRTTPFYASAPGEALWRTELWHFERPEEIWLKSQDELFIVLHRERLPYRAYKEKSIAFDPALGGLLPTEDHPVVDLGPIKLPAAKPGVRFRAQPKPTTQPDQAGGNEPTMNEAPVQGDMP